MTLRAKAQAVVDARKALSSTALELHDVPEFAKLSRSIGALSKWLRENPEGENCPECAGALKKDHNTYRCDECERMWPIEYFNPEPVPQPEAYRQSQGCGPTGESKCPECGNSLQNESPPGSPELLICAGCKLVFMRSVWDALLNPGRLSPQPEAVRCFKRTFDNAVHLIHGEGSWFFYWLDKKLNKNCVHTASTLEGLTVGEYPAIEEITPTAARQLLAEADWPEGLAKFDEKVVTTTEALGTGLESIHGRLDKPFHRPECTCLRCLAWIADHPLAVEPEPVVKEDLGTGEVQYFRQESEPQQSLDSNGDYTDARLSEIANDSKTLFSRRLLASNCLSARQERDRLRAEVEAKAETMGKAYVEQARLTSENEKLKKECDGWHGVVTDCEKVLRMEGTAESPLMSNLANVCRDKMSTIQSLTAENERLKGELASLKETAVPSEA